ncbi:hypothetical protein [Glaciimonas immobilis]|uniref:Uncharacterized protein n=1 Tax=Glaciimonas immobilis TaxID=728004 RepID=A0A840RX95_9BURK|nr:hypothetical protein [Glaciimonas immobilis]MBB5202525.1 hypothetical protein [Glaciimonas immobilis]
MRFRQPDWLVGREGPLLQVDGMGGQAEHHAIDELGAGSISHHVR